MSAQAFRFANAVTCAAGLAVLLAAIGYCQHGYELTDEGFYLNWIVDPWRYPNSVAQFGFVYHPFYKLFDGSIVTLRRVNVIFTMGLALYLVYCLQRENLKQSLLSTDNIATLPAAVAVMTLFLWGVFTPSYNSLVVQGVMITAIGVVQSCRTTWLASIAIGLGGALVFLGKPSSAVLLALVVPVVVWRIGRQSVKTLLFAAAASAVCMAIAALYISGGAEEFLTRMKGGHEGVVTLLPRYGFWEIVRIDSPLLKPGETVAFVLLVAFAIASVIAPRHFAKFESVFVGAIAAAALLLGAAFYAFPPLLEAIAGRPHRTAVLLAAVPLGLVLATLATVGADKLRARSHPLDLALFFAVVPYIVAFGTANNTTQQSSYAALFWTLAGLLVARDVLDKASSKVATAALVCSNVAICGVLVLAGWEVPYRQETALRLQHTPVHVGPNRSQTLLVDEETARYLNDLTAELTRMGFHDGDGIIDMTGESPGVEFAVGGVALGEPWLPGRYSGSAAYAIRALSRTPCDSLARAWVLLAPEGRRSLPVEVLASQGMDSSAAKQEQKVRRRHREDYHHLLRFKDFNSVFERCLLTRQNDN